MTKLYTQNQPGILNNSHSQDGYPQTQHPDESIRWITPWRLCVVLLVGLAVTIYFNGL